MTHIYNNPNNLSSTYGAIPPLTASQIYTTNSTSAGNWSIANISTDTVMVVKQDPATLEVTGNVVINGQDLEERLKTIEKVLMIPERDVILEKKHPKLKKLYNDYITALGKYRTFEAIKGEDNGTT